MNTNRFSSPGSRSLLGSVLLAALLLQVAAPAGSVVPSLATVPLGTFSPDPPRANLMFILDDSTSMERDFIPEDSGGASQYRQKCFGHYALNRIFYNPNVTYELPPRPDFPTTGKYAAPTNFTAVPRDGFNPALGTVNLTTAPVWAAADGGTNGTFYYTTYGLAGSPTSCSTTVQNALTRVTNWSSLTAEQKTNYAIWYAFYRTRILMMRSAVGQVLADIDAAKFRVGYSTITYTGVTNETRFHNIDDFDRVVSGKSTRQSILEKLYVANVGNLSNDIHYTPLRPALVKAGRYYANKLTGQTDPIQYSCQRNYTILTTDGYWNTASEGSNYIPKRIDGTNFSTSDGDAGAGAPYQDSYPYSLADISYYYYNTDLRPEMVDNVKVTAKDPSTKQHMNTFTLGLGVNGLLTYDPAYTDDQMKSVVWPDPLTSPLNTGNTVTSRIDDLWHAGINGRGRYYSAADPEQVVTSLRAALQSISGDIGVAAATATSSIAPTGTDNQLFAPSYEYQPAAVPPTPWQGDLKAYRLSVSGTTIGLPDLNSPEWSAQARLDARTPASRKILFRAGTTTALSQFTYANMTPAQRALFDNRCAAATPAASKLSQCASLGSTALANATGTNLVEFLRGDKTYALDSGTAATQVFRTRKSVLGDIINSSPTFVGKPPFKYVDAGYNDFVIANEGRRKMVYVGANDGMLHAFNAETGQEEWAFIPSRLLGDLWYLADANYDGLHRSYVDATPTLADVKVNGQWRTYLVGGLRAGGAEYYALDVTDPTNPVLKWEFTDANDPNLGLTFGNVVVTKLSDAGDWKAIFTSGYNNVTSGDGHGYLYVLNIADGSVHLKLSTAAQDGGSKTSPSNLSRINAWIESDRNNITKRLYGGDMLGNLWRFDVADQVPPAGNEAFLLGRALDAAGKAQPITTRPLLTFVGSGSQPNRGIVSFGTGKYLHPNDLVAEAANSPFSNQQSIYVVVDAPNTTTISPSFRSGGLISRNPAGDNSKVDLGTAPGMYIDLPEARERINIDGLQFNRLLAFASSIPQTTDPCLGGGRSNVYYLNVNGTVTTEKMDGLVVGAQRLFNPIDGKPGDGSKGGTLIFNTPGGTSKREVEGVGSGLSGSRVRRASWRELVD